MRVVIGTEHLFGLAGFVGLPLVGDGHGSKDHAFLIAQGDILAGFDGFGEVLGDIQRDRHRPKGAIGQTHVIDDSVIVFLAQEALERVETAIHQQFKIANLARGQIVRGEVPRFDFQLLRTVVGHIQFGDRGQILHRATYFLRTGDGRCARPSPAMWQKSSAQPNFSHNGRRSADFPRRCCQKER